MDNKIVQIILAILLPPLAVYFKAGTGTPLIISIVLTLLFFLPGQIHALITVLK